MTHEFRSHRRPYAGPNTRLGLATAMVWHNADQNGQMALYLREQHRAASQRNPPELHDRY